MDFDRVALPTVGISFASMPAAGAIMSRALEDVLMSYSGRSSHENLRCSPNPEHWLSMLIGKSSDGVWGSHVLPNAKTLIEAFLEFMRRHA